MRCRKQQWASFPSCGHAVGMLTPRCTAPAPPNPTRQVLLCCCAARQAGGAPAVRAGAGGGAGERPGGAAAAAGGCCLRVGRMWWLRLLSNRWVRGHPTAAATPARHSAGHRGGPEGGAQQRQDLAARLPPHRRAVGRAARGSGSAAAHSSGARKRHAVMLQRPDEWRLIMRISLTLSFPICDYHKGFPRLQPRAQAGTSRRTPTRGPRGRRGALDGAELLSAVNRVPVIASVLSSLQ